MNTTKEELKKAVAIISKTNLILQEFLALIAGIKPVMIYQLNPNEINLIKTNFPELNIACRDKIICNKKSHACALSKNKSLAQKTIDSFCRDGSKWQLTGDLLGYPKCCVENWLKYSNQNQQYNSSLITYQTYKSTQKCNLFCNNLLNFSTRVGDKEFNDFLHYQSFNKNLPIPYGYFQFISHIPCRYDCPESIKIGKEVDSLLNEYAPKVEKIVKYTLSKPILFFDLFKLVIFDGYIKEGVLYYQKIIPPFFLVDNSLMEKIKSGNRITIDNKKIEILKNDSTLFVYQKKNEADGFILDFSEDWKL